MSIIHFLNVLEGDCNIIQHSNSNHVTMIDVCNADSDDIYENVELRKAIYEDISDSITGNFGQKKYPENPLRYLEKLKIKSIMRFIITHPDMDHLDGIKDLFNDFKITNVWDTSNKKEIKDFSSYGRFNDYDWKFYEKLRAEKIEGYKYLKLYSDKNNSGLYWDEDNIKILAPTTKLIDSANKNNKDYNDASYVLLFTPPIKGTTKKWKIIFAGDSYDDTWTYILDNYESDVSNIDILVAPHHGRDSQRDFSFLKHLNPRMTLLGNASHQHLAYNKYPNFKLTNNQVGSIIINCSDKLYFYIKNEKFRNNYWVKKGWANPPSKNYELDAYFLFNLVAR